MSKESAKTGNAQQELKFCHKRKRFQNVLRAMHGLCSGVPTTKNNTQWVLGTCSRHAEMQKCTKQLVSQTTNIPTSFTEKKASFTTSYHVALQHLVVAQKHSGSDAGRLAGRIAETFRLLTAVVRCPNASQEVGA